MTQRALFDTSDIPTRQQVAKTKLRYHLYFEKDGVRRYLYWRGHAGRTNSYWCWMTLEEAGRRKRKTYHDSISAGIQQRAWQRDAKDGIVVCIEGYEVTS